MIRYNIGTNAYDLLDKGAFLLAGGEEDIDAHTGPVGDIEACICKESGRIAVYTHIQTRWNGGVSNNRRNTTLLPINIGDKVVLLRRGDFFLEDIDYSFNLLETNAGGVELPNHKSDVICTVLRGRFEARSQAQLESSLDEYVSVANQFYAHLMDPRNSENNQRTMIGVSKAHRKIAEKPAYVRNTLSRDLIFMESSDNERLNRFVQTLHDTDPFEEARAAYEARSEYVHSTEEEDPLFQPFGKAEPKNMPNKSSFSLLEGINWDEIGGFKRQKEQVMTFVDNWLDPESARYAGIDPKKSGGMIFFGPSGWGKSMFADAAGTYAYNHVDGGVLYMFRSYGNLASIYRGGEALKLKEDFRLIKKMNGDGKKVVYFFDEVQSAGERDESPNKCGNELLDQLLVELTQVDYGMTLVMAATARDPSKIDPQLLRPGRLGEHVYLAPPIPSEDAADIVRVIIEKSQSLAAEHGNTQYVMPEGVDYKSIGPQIIDLSPAEIDKAIREALNPKILKYRKEKVWTPFSTEEIIAGTKVIRSRKALASANIDNI